MTAAKTSPVVHRYDLRLECGGMWYQTPQRTRPYRAKNHLVTYVATLGRVCLESCGSRNRLSVSAINQSAPKGKTLWRDKLGGNVDTVSTEGVALQGGRLRVRATWQMTRPKGRRAGLEPWTIPSLNPNPSGQRAGSERWTILNPILPFVLLCDRALVGESGTSAGRNPSMPSVAILLRLG